MSSLQKVLTQRIESLGNYKEVDVYVDYEDGYLTVRLQSDCITSALIEMISDVSLFNFSGLMSKGENKYLLSYSKRK